MAMWLWSLSVTLCDRSPDLVFTVSADSKMAIFFSCLKQESNIQI